MTQFLKLTFTIAIPDDNKDVDLYWLDETFRETCHEMGVVVCDSCAHKQVLVDAEWIDAIANNYDDDDDDGSFDFRPHPPSIGVTASPPQPLNLTGIDPDSPEADDIREAHTEARTPDPDQPW